jgi:hypothetical protein
MEPAPLTVSEGRRVISSNNSLLPFGSSLVCVETSNVNSGGGKASPGTELSKRQSLPLGTPGCATTGDSRIW